MLGRRPWSVPTIQDQTPGTWPSRPELGYFLARARACARTTDIQFRGSGQPVAIVKRRAARSATARQQATERMESDMARSLALHYRRRRMQRWLRREALLLAKESEMFDCVDATRAAQRLVDIVEGRDGFLYELQSA